MTGKTKYTSAAALAVCAGIGLLYTLRQSQAENAPALKTVAAAPTDRTAPAAGAGTVDPDTPAVPVPVSVSAAAAVPAAPAASGNPALGSRKVGVVDMARVFTAYHKTAQMEKKLNEDKSKAKKEMDGKTEKYRELAARLAKIEKILMDKLVNEQLKQQTRVEGEALMREANTMARDIQEFGARRERQLQDHYLRMRKLLVEDILTRLREKAKRDNYDFVFDKSGLGSSGTFILPVSREAFDFSSEVIAELNRNVPNEDGSSAAAAVENPAKSAP
ncbi:MAG: OmpH family outer membrane protein [Verrucomicrobiota bacterium]